MIVFIAQVSVLQRSDELSVNIMTRLDALPQSDSLLGRRRPYDPSITEKCENIRVVTGWIGK